MTRDQPNPPRPPMVICANCQASNEPSRTTCRNCQATLPGKSS